jgi:DNA mismatch repair endonuclease MutH
MSNRKFNDKNELLEYARRAIGQPIGNFDMSNRLLTGKGAVGMVMEEGYFGYRPNSNSKPDFEELGVELKVTPFVRTRKAIRSKERLVCNIIDYMTEYLETFETSSFSKKCNIILLMLYEYIENISKSNYEIDEAVLFSFPEEDLVIIRDDWYKIISKIRDGKAHEISESDTLYLGACTKGANSKSLRQQPFSDIMAMQRAYSLKTSYMTYILREYIYGERTSESIIKYPGLLRDLSFEEWIVSQIIPFYGRNIDSLVNEFNIQSTPKNLNEIILSKILGLNGRISKSSEFLKANIVPKTIKVKSNGQIVESMSFPNFKFTDIINQEWEESQLYEYLSQTKFLFVVFKEVPGVGLVLSKVQFWNIPQEDLEEVKKVWERTKHIIKCGVEITIVNGRNTNNLPKKFESDVAHVRPHARKASDTYLLPDGRELTKQCFWLNNSYIEKQINTE